MILRPWTEADLDAWSGLCPESKAENLVSGPRGADSDDRSRLHQAAAAWEHDGLGLLACELLRGAPADREPDPSLIGTVGFTPTTAPLARTFGHEIKVRFLPAFWGSGYAFEAASAALTWGFEGDQLETVGAMIGIGDDRYAELAKRLGMSARFRTVAVDSSRWCSAYTLDAELWQKKRSEPEAENR